MIAKNIKIKKILAIILTAFLVATAMPLTGNEVSAVTNLRTSYAATVQKYTVHSGYFTLKSTSRFYLVRSNAPGSKLASTVKLADSEFAAKKMPTSKVLPIVYGPESQTKTGDIVIKIIPGKYSKEAFAMTVGKKVVISASTSDGVFRGLRSLLKYRIATGSNSLRKCYVVDYPDVKERTVHLDCARKYYSPTWIKNFIKRSSWQGYNAIEIHFSEDQGLRLESKKYPWLAGSYNKSKGVITQKQMAEIISVANKYHVEVIPSFDSPGHMNYITKRYKNYVASHSSFKFKYNGKTYSRSSKGFKNIANYFSYGGSRTGYQYIGIDLSNRVAVAFTSSLIDEYAKFFHDHGCKKFNIGGDELLGWNTVRLKGKTFDQNTKWRALQHWDRYARNVLKVSNGNATDTFVSYMNKTATRLEKMGYTCRMWNDEIYRFSNQHVRLKRSIRVVYWSNNYRPVKSLESKGYKMYNALSLWTYYVIGVDYKYVKADKIYAKWKPKNFASPGTRSKYIDSSKYLGAYFCIWCDYATKKTTSRVWSDTNSLTWSSSIKMMNTSVTTSKSGSGKALSYSRYKAYRTRLGTFPGYSGNCLKTSRLPLASAIKKVVVPSSDPPSDPPVEKPDEDQGNLTEEGNGEESGDNSGTEPTETPDEETNNLN